jgi:hypothetical protein
MKRFPGILWSGAVLAAALLLLGGAVGAGPTPPRERQRAARPAVLPDATPAVPEGKAQLASQLTWRDPPPPRPYGMQVRMEILVGRLPLQTVPHAGKTYLPVPHMGAEYEIRVWNDGPRRVAAVVSVDGLSVITGQPASTAQPGYIVAPYGSILISGWRRRLERVAAFRFVERGQSYAERMGHPENVGVIGLVAFEEQIARPRPALEWNGLKSAAPRLYGQVGGLGTEYGRDLDSHAYYVPFVRSGNRRAITIYYDSVDALRRAGVPVDGPTPVPFPGDGTFAPPPPAYKGL